jgi:uncharacterized protein (TIGR00299 family) protein
MRLAYFDCFSGITGGMALAALVHAGADVEAIKDILGYLPVSGFTVEVEEVEVRGIAATRIHVDSAPQGVIWTYASIRTMMDQADIPDEPRRTAQRVFRLLAGASARVHAKDIELVTFHEFGEIESLVEVVGCAVALDMLGVERAFASPVPTGLGMARTDHGMMPIPSPVVVELLQGVPTYSRGVPVELVTPVGAAILAAVVEGYGDLPMIRTDRVGYGAGHLRVDFPNALRVVIGQEHRAAEVVPAIGPPAGLPGDVLVEANLDDIETERCERLMDRLIGAGAHDTWVTPVMGRRGQARMTLSAVTPISGTEGVVEVLRSEHGVRGIRVSPVQVVEPGSEG